MKRLPDILWLSNNNLHLMGKRCEGKLFLLCLFRKNSTSPKTSPSSFLNHNKNPYLTKNRIKIQNLLSQNLKQKSKQIDTFSHLYLYNIIFCSPTFFPVRSFVGNKEIFHQSQNYFQGLMLKPSMRLNLFYIHWR